MEAIYSTSPYITNHLVALKLKRISGLPWIAEFRDPWAYSGRSESPDLWKGWRRRRESEICSLSDHFVTVSKEYLAHFRSHHSLSPDSSSVIYNSFDPLDFSFLESSKPASFPKFSIAHAGLLYGGERSPQPLLEALNSLSQSSQIDLGKVSLEFYGPYEKHVDEMIDRAGLSDQTVWHGTFDYHSLLPLLAQAYCLLLITHCGIPWLPAKLFDYMGARRPIIAITDEGSEVGEIISETGAGFSIGHHETTGLAALISRLWKRWAAGDPFWIDYPEEKLTPYQNPQQARSLARILEYQTERTAH